MKDAVEILKEHLSDRKLTNKSYSLRAFARDLELSPQQLSNVMNGSRGLGAQTAAKVAKKLELSPFDEMIFLESFRVKFSNSPTLRAIAQAKLKEVETDSSSRSLELDLFKVISSWQHMALLELIKISKDQSSRFFSKRLGISETEVELSLARLERLELISRCEKKKWKVNQDTVIADRGVSTDAIKKYHKQILEKAIEALQLQTSDERYGSSSTLPVTVKNLDRAKKLIQKFRSDFSKEISDEKNGQEIYGLSIQFFRLTDSKNHES